MKASPRNSMINSVAIFIGLAVVFAALLIASVNVTDPFTREVMLSVGGAVFGSGLTFFLIRLFTLRE